MRDEVRDSIVRSLREAERSYQSQRGYPSLAEDAKAQVAFWQKKLMAYDSDSGNSAPRSVLEEIRDELQEIKALLKSKGVYR